MLTMRKNNYYFKTGILLIMLLLTINNTAIGTNTASQDITITVEPINEISLSLGSVDLVINTANAGITAGDENFTVTDDSTTMSYTTNESNKKITASLDGTFNNITFKVNVTSTSGISAGEKTISMDSTDIITDLGNASDTGEIITYSVTAVPNTIPNGGESNIITFTLIDS